MGSYGGVPQERNQDATVYVGDLDTQVNEALLWELFLQAGPVGMLFTFYFGFVCLCFVRFSLQVILICCFWF